MDQPARTTRYGRVVKKPERYEPVEAVEDDFSDSDLESHWDSDISSEISYDTEEEEDESDTDDSFVTSDSEGEENEEDKNEASDNNSSDEDGSDDDSDIESTGSSPSAAA